MLNSLLVLLSLTTAHAAPEVLKLTKLHCDSCREMIQKSACEGKEQYASCKVSFTNKEKTDADLVIETKPGQNLDKTALIKQIEALGYEAKPASASAKAPSKK